MAIIDGIRHIPSPLLPPHIVVLGFLCDKYATISGKYDENLVQNTKIGRFFRYIVR